MSTTPRLGSTDPFQLLSNLYNLQLSLKISHLTTKSLAAHEALGKIYSELDELLDDLAEKWIGYSGKVPGELRVGTVLPGDPAALGKNIISLGDKVTAFGTESSFGDIENLGQEVSGLGAKLIYLSRLS